MLSTILFFPILLVISSSPSSSLRTSVVLEFFFFLFFSSVSRLRPFSPGPSTHPRVLCTLETTFETQPSSLLLPTTPCLHSVSKFTLPRSYLERGVLPNSSLLHPPHRLLQTRRGTARCDLGAAASLSRIPSNLRLRPSTSFAPSHIQAFVSELNPIDAGARTPCFPAVLVARCSSSTLLLSVWAILNSSPPSLIDSTQHGSTPAFAFLFFFSPFPPICVPNAIPNLRLLPISRLSLFRLNHAATRTHAQRMLIATTTPSRIDQ